MKHAIVGDIGGTNARLAIAKLDESIEIVMSFVFDSQKITDICHQINETLKQAKEKHNIECSIGVFSVAGPVINHKHSKLTNTAWDINSEKILKGTLLQKVAIINDFEAVGYAIENLDIYDDSQIIQLNNVQEQKGLTKCVIGAGTGLGMSILAFDGKRYNPIPSEGGHTDLVVCNDIEYSYLNFLKKNKKNSHPDMEDAVSGRGLYSIYQFLQLIKYDEQLSATKKEIANASDKPAKVSEYALKNKDRVAVKALDMFTIFYARAAKNLALASYSASGIYIAGGIAPKMIAKLKDGHFIKEFCNHESEGYSELLGKMPVYVILDEKAELLGAANYAFNFM